MLARLEALSGESTGIAVPADSPAPAAHSDVQDRLSEIQNVLSASTAALSKLESQQEALMGQVEALTTESTEYADDATPVIGERLQSFVTLKADEQATLAKRIAALEDQLQQVPAAEQKQAEQSELLTTLVKAFESAERVREAQTKQLKSLQRAVGELREARAPAPDAEPEAPAEAPT